MQHSKTWRDDDMLSIDAILQSNNIKVEFPLSLNTNMLHDYLHRCISYYIILQNYSNMYHAE